MECHNPQHQRYTADVGDYDIPEISDEVLADASYRLDIPFGQDLEVSPLTGSFIEKNKLTLTVQVNTKPKVVSN